MPPGFLYFFSMHYIFCEKITSKIKMGCRKSEDSLHAAAYSLCFSVWINRCRAKCRLIKRRVRVLRLAEK